MDQRVQFIAAIEAADQEPFSVLCARFGISRKTGYKWLERYNEGGPNALYDASSRPKRSPNATPDEAISVIIELRREHPSWGPKKLYAALTRQVPEKTWPAPSTIGDLLKRHGLILPRKRRIRWPAGQPPFAQADQPNDTWCVDFKGDFVLGNGSRCYPLTITDLHSRFILAITAMDRIDTDLVIAEFERIFALFGLPRRIRSDNGVPFATLAPARLSRLSMRWHELGIEVERIEPGHPEQNGAHERMHRTLKSDVLSSVANDRVTQQLSFDRFRVQFNEHRPHEALSMNTPHSKYTCSPRRLPAFIAPPEYPQADRVLRVYDPGKITLQNKRIKIHRMLIGEQIGLIALDDTKWRVQWRRVILGVLDTSCKTPQLQPEKAITTPR